ncbi:MAG: type II toxin-antitoxin system death-on-curing family toxin [Acidobacteriaceae bacterium]|nr:type II toxin-antitoxin system death-on-curing family toxin [Acidobacteriaceae bacterium]
MTQWRWIKESSVLAIHDAQLAEHGGMPGVRDMSLLVSALARPRNLAAYGSPDLADLAAAYGAGIVRNHAFVDGNKRTGFVVALAFTQKNGCIVQPNQRDAVNTWLALADGKLSEAELAQWFRGYMRPLSSS